MPNYLQLPCRDDDGNLQMVVEAPRGSAVKLKYDPKQRVFAFNRALPLGTVYPYEWGFIPGTLAEDGDPLDAMALLDAPTWPGTVIACRPLGIVRVTQRVGRKPRERNDRVIAVATGDSRYRVFGDLPKRVRSQIEGFFLSASQTSKKVISLEGWEGTKAARLAIEKAAAAFDRRGA